MENYTKGETQEVQDDPVFPMDGQTGVEMKVNSGSKIRNLMGFAMKKMKEPQTKQMTWNGSGNAITKTVSCAEIMKRKIKGLHQITKIRYRRMEEYWDPKVEGLERLKVNKDIPAISILLSKDPLDTSEPGYQAPGSFDEFWKGVVQADKPTNKRRPRPRSGAANQETQSADVRKNKKKKKDGPNDKAAKLRENKKEKQSDSKKVKLSDKQETQDMSKTMKDGGNKER